MDKLTTNVPVHEALELVGYKVVGVFPDDFARNGNGLIVKTPQGVEREVKVHKTAASSGADGRHWYGIHTETWDLFQDAVFFAKHERWLIIVPTSYLHDVYKSEQSLASVKNKQWQVDLLFDRDGKQYLEPTGFVDNKRPLSEFAHRIPDVAIPRLRELCE